jgi:hypothetical protein
VTDLAIADWKEAQPGDTVVVSPWTRLESITFDKDFSTGSEMLYCLCIGRVASTTTSGLTLIKVYLLTPTGVGYKRFNLGGDRTGEKRVYRTWT